MEPTCTRSPREVQVLRQESSSHHAHRLLHPTSRPQLAHAWRDAAGQDRRRRQKQTAVSDRGSCSGLLHPTSRPQFTHAWWDGTRQDRRRRAKQTQAGHIAQQHVSELLRVQCCAPHSQTHSRQRQRQLQGSTCSPQPPAGKARPTVASTLLLHWWASRIYLVAQLCVGAQPLPQPLKHTCTHACPAHTCMLRLNTLISSH